MRFKLLILPLISVTVAGAVSTKGRDIVISSPAIPSPLSAIPLITPPIVSVGTSTETATGTVTGTVTGRAWRETPAIAFKIPEHLDFVIKWGVVNAGSSTLHIEKGENEEGRPTFHLISEASSTGMVDTFYRVRDRNESWIDQASLVTVKYQRHIREGAYRLEETVVLNQPSAQWKRISHRIDKNLIEEKFGELPVNALDAFGSLYYARALPLEVGKMYEINVHSSDTAYPMVMKVEKRETISVPAGTFDCLKVEPLLRGPGIFIAKGKKLEVWLTADERHMPVKMRSEVFFGHVSADLVKYQ